MSEQRNGFRQNKLVAGMVSAMALAMSTGLFADTVKINIDIKSQVANKAILDLAAQTDTHIVLSKGIGDKLQLPDLKGEYTVASALDKMLSGTGLTYEFVSEDSVVIREQSEKEKQRSSEEMEDLQREVDEEIIVTGSRLITDPGKLTRQITVFDREEIERSGATRLDEFLRRLPQNVNAPTNVGSGFSEFGFGTEFGVGRNVFAGSSVNLRGLGAQYTLILIDGRRPAKGGQFGDITDISNIPIDRVERIEILFDGAAAIYGADAIGGVVNIITSREYDGTSLSVRYSDTTGGGGASYTVTLGHTFQWDSGSLTVTVPFQGQDKIDGSQRQLGLQDSSVGLVIMPPSINGNVRGNTFLDEPLFWRPLMWVNGDQRLSAGVEVPAYRQVWNGSAFELVETTAIVDRQNPFLPFGYSWIDEAADRPQNPEILGFTPVYQGNLPEYNGQPLGLNDFSDSGELGETSLVPFEGQAITPEDSTYSISASLFQAISDDITMRLGLNYSTTSKVSDNLGNDSTVIINADSPSNPFLQRMAFAYQHSLPQQSQDVDGTTYSLSGGIDWQFSDSWNAAFGFGASMNRQNADTTNFIRRSQNGTADSVDARLQGYYTDMNGNRVEIGTIFNDPLLGYGSVEELRSALVVPFLHTHRYTDSYDTDIRLAGKLFELPAGDARTSISLGYRKDKLEVFNSNPEITSSIDGIAGNYDESGGTDAKSLAVEFSIPVFGGDFNLPLVDSLLLSFSVRTEDLSDSDGDNVNWGAGFNWGVSEEFTIRLNRTYSLRAPESIRSAGRPRWTRLTSYQIYDNDGNFVTSINQPLWAISGSANHLRPERSYGTELGFVYRPSFARGLDMQLNITQARLVDKLGNPSSGSWTFETILPENVLNNPLLTFGDPANNPFHASALFNGIAMLPGELVRDNRTFNIGENFNQGADFRVGYNLNTDIGNWRFNWSHQYVHVNEVTRTKLCDLVGVSCTLDQSAIDQGRDQPIDTVGSLSRDNFSGLSFAIPQHRGSISLGWDYRGLGVNLNTGYTETTSVFRSVPLFNGGPTNIIREDSRPRQAINVNFTYDFGHGDLFDAPDWLENARVSLTLDELFRISEQKKTSTIVQREWTNEELERLFSVQEINRFSVRPRGRAFTIGFNTRF